MLAVYLLPKIARPLATALLIIAGLAILGGGIYGLIEGERPVEHEVDGSHAGTGCSGGTGSQPGQEAPAVNEHGLGPVVSQAAAS